MLRAMQRIHEVQIVAEWWDDGSMFYRVQRGAQGAPSLVPAPPPEVGRSSAIQIAECRIGGRRVAVVKSYPALLTQPQRRTVSCRVRDALGPTVFAYEIDSRESRCDLDEAFLDSEEDGALAAMASAIVKASWGWDESAQISVRIGSKTLLVEPRNGTSPEGDRHWTATISG
jgi:hypothetical protein